MKLGLVTDIHEEVELLRLALDRLHQQDVDRIVMIGDIVCDGSRLAETCQLLADANVLGVWGNHDFGICKDPGEELLAMFPSTVHDYLRTLRPHLELQGCRFAHVEPWLDPECLEDIWHFQGPPETREDLDRIFNAVDERLLFGGHYHRWLLATPHELTSWNGESEIRLLPEERYFVVVGALCEGRYAMLDTDANLLTPFNEPRRPTASAEPRA